MTLRTFNAADSHNTLARVLVEQAERYGPKALLRNATDGGVISYAELAQRAEAASAGLRERGVAAGSVVAIYLADNLACVQSVFACLFAGAINVSVNPDFRKTALAFALDTVVAEAVFTDGPGLQNLLDGELRACLERLKLVVLTGDTEGEVRARLSQAAPGCTLATLPELLAAGAKPRIWEGVDAALPAVIRFTSGTTGRPKGIIQTHLHVLNKCAAHNRLLAYGEDDILYTPFPLYHGLASVMGLMGTLSAGATMVTSPKFSASRYWKEASQSGATLAHLLFSLVPLVEAQEPARWEQEHRVRSIYVGPRNGAFEARFRTRFVQCYSNGEVGIVSCQREGGSAAETNYGLPLPEMDVRIVDDLDRSLAQGESGEIVVRPRLPHHVMVGYVNDLAATVRAFRNLWYHTGDAGFIDEAGELHFTGRIGDTIRRRGVNISSQQVESEIRLDPQVLDCAVIGVPSPTGEQELHACLVWKQAPPDPGAAMKQLHEFLGERLPRSYVPRFYEQLDELPMTPTGKVQKALLRSLRPHGPTWEWDRGNWTKLDSGDKA